MLTATDVARFSPGQRQAFYDALSPQQREALYYLWSFWARPEQIEPPGNWRYHLILAGRGWGKALQLSMRLPTPSGWTSMGELQPGDQVFDEAGRPCTVTAVFEVNPERAYRLWFSDGTSIEACSEHQWVTWTAAERKAYLRSPYEDTTRFPDNWPAFRLRRLLGWQLPEAVIREALALQEQGASARQIARRLGVCRQALAAPLQAGRYLPREARVYPDSPGPRVRTTQEIAETLREPSKGGANHCIPVCRPLQLPDAALPVEPYVLGVWLGDGSSADATLTVCDADAAELLALIEAAGMTVNRESGRRKEGTGCAMYGLGRREPRRDAVTGRMLPNGSLHSQLAALGLLRNKHVPAVYLRASSEQRLALLQGLMDTDGSFKNGMVEFSSTNEHLAAAVVELARSLGQKPVSALGRAKIEGRDCGPKWLVTWTPTLPVFRLSRKRTLLRFGGAQSLRHHHRMIVAAEPIPAEPMRCITVDSPHSLFLAGEAMIPTHNTRTGGEWVRKKIRTFERVNLIGATADDVRDIMVEGESGLLAICPKDERPTYLKGSRQLKWPNGALSLLFTADEPERLRGKQHMALWADELASWRYEEAWHQSVFGLRIGSNPQAVITTTPRPTPIIKELVADAATIVTRGSTYDNRGNLNPAFYQQIIKKYEGTRLGRQELLAQILDDNPAALWKRALIDQHRVSSIPPLHRIVVAVDPAASDGESACETGIIVSGVARVGAELHGYVLGDYTLRGTPLEWARAVVTAYNKHNACRVVAEVNQGGQMVEHTVRSVDRNISYRAVRAAQGKSARAEPIAAFYEQGRVHHFGSYPALEDQMCEWEPGKGESPDRIDALVWGLSDLMLGKNKQGWGF